MLKATTLVHKGALQIGVHAINSFARHFSKTHILHIHTDPSVDENDQQLLLKAADGMQAKIVTAQERAQKISNMLSTFPKTKALLKTGSYFTKLELPMYEGGNLFYFDSDIVWLRHVENLKPTAAPNAFSTESWTWYPGIINDSKWLKLNIARRVNTGFYFVTDSFPYDKMESLLNNDMFDSSLNYAGDQELFSYLYNNMEYYHPADLKRSRIGTIYHLKTDGCAALHFPGKMWLSHLDQIEQLPLDGLRPVTHMRFLPPVAISALELYKMRIRIKAGDSVALAGPINVLRRLRKAFSR